MMNSFGTTHGGSRLPKSLCRIEPLVVSTVIKTGDGGADDINGDPFLSEELAMVIPFARVLQRGCQLRELFI
jgi:hypothetical protein